MLFRSPRSFVSTAAPLRTQSFEVSVAKAQAAGSATSMTVTITNSYGTETTRNFTGIRLRDFLGVNAATLNRAASITAISRDGRTQTYYYNDIIFDKTLLAWVEDGEQLSYPRLCPGNSKLTGDYLKEVVSITLKY